MPEAHRRHNECQPRHLREWANGIGHALGHVVDRQLTERLEAACQQALELATTDYPRIRAILEHGLEAQPTSPATEAGERRDHANLRGGACYTAEPS